MTTKTMRAVHIVAPGRPEFVEIPVPELRRGCGLVRPLMIAVCGSDVRSVYYAPAEEYPLAVTRGGHEIIARIEALPGPAPGLREGQVVMALVAGDLGMSEYVLAPVENLLPLPEGRPLEQLLMAQQLGTVIFGCKRLPSVVGLDAAVIGQGSVGLFFDAMLRRLGARRVVAMDLLDTRVEAARKAGATHAFNNGRCDPVATVKEMLEGQLTDLVVEAAGEPETINLMPSLVKERGTILSFGLLHGPHTIPFNYYNLYRKSCALLTVGGGTAQEPGRKSVRQALDMIGRGEIDVSWMVTHRFPFDRVKEAYEMARTRADGAIKVVVQMPE